jgi:hypothetical protein
MANGPIEVLKEKPLYKEIVTKLPKGLKGDPKIKIPVSSIIRSKAKVEN